MEGIRKTQKLRVFTIDHQEKIKNWSSCSVISRLILIFNLTQYLVMLCCPMFFGTFFSTSTEVCPGNVWSGYLCNKIIAFWSVLQKKLFLRKWYLFCFRRVTLLVLYFKCCAQGWTNRNWYCLCEDIRTGSDFFELEVTWQEIYSSFVMSLQWWNNYTKSIPHVQTEVYPPMSLCNIFPEEVWTFNLCLSVNIKKY